MPPRMDGSATVLSNNFSGQLGQGIGGALTGWVLSLCGYVAAEGDAVAARPAGAIMGIRILYAIVPLVMMTGIAICSYYLSKLNKKMPEIEKALKQAEGQRK